MNYQQHLDDLILGNLSDYHSYINSMGPAELARYCHWLFFRGADTNSRVVVARAFQHMKIASERRRHHA